MTHDPEDIKKVMRNLSIAYGKHDVAAMVHVEPLAQMLMDNPDRAIDLIVATYENALDDAYTTDEGNIRGFIEGIAGGPMELIPHKLYNAVGAIYPYLKREQKDRALRGVLSILDRRNYLEVNGATAVGHTPGIREPLLLADIKITRHLYWPGLDEGKLLIPKYTTFSELKEDVIDEYGHFNRKVLSDFLVAYALLRSDISPYGEEYAKVAEPLFLERTVQAIVAMRFAHSDIVDIQKGKERLEELLPKSVHERIEPLRLKADWVDYTKFP